MLPASMERILSIYTRNNCIYTVDSGMMLKSNFLNKVQRKINPLKTEWMYKQ